MISAQNLLLLLNGNRKLKIEKLNIKFNFLLSIGFCLLSSFSLYAQEKESTDIHKTRSSAIIAGVNYYLHTVEKGQTLFAIARFYKKDVNDIVIDNPYISAHHGKISILKKTEGDQDSVVVIWLCGVVRRADGFSIDVSGVIGRG